MQTGAKVGVAVVVIALALVSIFALGGFSSLGLRGFPLAANQQNGAACTSLQNINCGQQVGGTVTALSEVDFASNYAPLNGPAWLVSFVLNGNGQYLFGSTSQQIAQAVNSTYNAPATPISISAKLNSQQLVIPYSYGGQDLYQLKAQQVTFTFSWFSNGAGYETQCAQSNQTIAPGSTYAFACAGYYSAADDVAVFKGYNSTCIGDGGKPFVSNSTSELGAVYATEYKLQCWSVTSASVGSVFQAGSPTISENVSVVYTNATGSHAIYLTTAYPEGNFDNEIFANIYGYSVGSLNTFIGTTSPTLVITPGNSKYLYLNPATSTDIAQLNELPSTAYQSAGIEINGVPQGYLYSLQALTSAISQQNTNVNNYLQEQVQPTSPFSGMQTAGLAADAEYGLSGYPEFGILNVTKNPVFYPEIQFIAPLAFTKSLGVAAPVSQPVITSEVPSPLTIQSGSSATATFTVVSNVSGSAYIVVRLASNDSTVAQSPAFAVGPATSTVQLTIPAYTKNLANTAVNYTAQICSTTVTECSSFTFDAVIKPNCAPGGIYVNNTSCQSETTTCQAGYAWNGTACALACAPPAILAVNATTGQSTCIIPSAGAAGDALAIVVVIIVIVVIAFVLIYFYLRKHKHPKARRRRR